MKTNALVLLAITTFTASAAYAGPNCGMMRGIYQTTPSVNPAIVSYRAHPHAGAYRVIPAGYYGTQTAYHGDPQSYGKQASDKTETDIVETAVTAGSFGTLIKAIQAAGLEETLKGEGPFTVFAPTDEAFAKLPEGTLESLLADEEKLTKVLTYHVVLGKIMAADLISQDSVATLEGTPIPSRSLQLSKADIVVSNGVIHVVDEVLIPQML